MALAHWRYVSMMSIEVIYTKSYVPAAMEGALSQVCWT